LYVWKRRIGVYTWSNIGTKESSREDLLQPSVNMYVSLKFVEVFAFLWKIWKKVEFRV
jgi:hypothetical protein